jgi:hypothetical protein
MWTLCPDANIELYEAVFRYSFIVPEITGPVSVLRSWTRVRHFPEVLAICPALKDFTILDDQTTWARIEEDVRQDVDLVVTARKMIWRNRITLLPQEGGSLVFGEAAFRIEDAGGYVYIPIAIGIGIWILRFVIVAAH